MLKQAVFAIALMISPLLYAADGTTLRLFIWEDYFPEKLLKTFKTQTQIQVEQVFYETDELKDETLINTNGGQGLDLIIGSRASLKEYAKHGWLIPYDASKLTNLNHIEERWLPDTPLKNVSVPYLWGTVGIAYRKDKLPQTITSWSDLFNPSKNLRQKILMINDSRDTIGLALKSLGYSINSTDEKELKSAKELLLNQKPFVKTYSYTELNNKAAIVKGDIWMTMLYNGDGVALKALNDNIEFTVPSEGTNLWVDDIAVFKKSKNAEAALKFIDFINSPENAATIAQHLYYATPNKSARKHLEKDFIKDERIYPSDSVIEKSEFFNELSPRQLKQRNDIFLKVLK